MRRLPLSLVLLLAALPSLAEAADCPGRPDGLGTARVLAVDAATTAPLGRKHFPQTLPLAPKEVVLTFDDGPIPGPTDRVLAALRQECVRATFFLLGRNTVAHPKLARRALAEGHTMAHHTYSHPLLNRMPLNKAGSEIQRGIAAVESVLYGEPAKRPRVPFFRFPGFAGSPALLELLARRGIAVFGADLWASDWNRMTPAQERELLLGRLEAKGSGFVLLHDTQPQTAAMLPEFLRDLKRRGYQVVHVVPAAAPATVAHRR
jgi:peptidoglycan/xylan/chitin deacetylase (PgdA/CDA1 family)